MGGKEPKKMKTIPNFLFFFSQFMEITPPSYFHLETVLKKEAYLRVGGITNLVLETVLKKGEYLRVGGTEGTEGWRSIHPHQAQF